MAKPITEPRPLSRDAAEAFSKYLESARPDPEKRVRLERDKVIHENISRAK